MPDWYCIKKTSTTFQVFLYVAVDMKLSQRDTEQVLHFDENEVCPSKGLWKPAVLDTLCSQNSYLFYHFCAFKIM